MVKVNNIAKIEIKIWSSPNESLSMEESIEKIKKLGNNILEIDYINNRILISHTIQESDG